MHCSRAYKIANGIVGQEHPTFVSVFFADKKGAIPSALTTTHKISKFESWVSQVVKHFDGSLVREMYGRRKEYIWEFDDSRKARAFSVQLARNPIVKEFDLDVEVD